jgi:hypothetical protein
VLAVAVILLLIVVNIGSSGYGMSLGMNHREMGLPEFYAGTAPPFVMVAAAIVLFSRLQGYPFLITGLILFAFLLPTLTWYVPHGAPLWLYALPSPFVAAWCWIGIREEGTRPKAHAGSTSEQAIARQNGKRKSTYDY